MTDRSHALPAPADADEQARRAGEAYVEKWVQAALSLGSKGLREQVAVPNPKGGYIVVTRNILGAGS